MCLDNWWTNSQINQERVMYKMADSGASNETVTVTMANVMTAVHPQYNWATETYANVSGYNNHEVIGVDYTAWFHFDQKYDATVIAQTCTNCRDSPDVSHSSYWQWWADSGYDA